MYLRDGTIIPGEKNMALGPIGNIGNIGVGGIGGGSQGGNPIQRLLQQLLSGGGQQGQQCQCGCGGGCGGGGGCACGCSQRAGGLLG